MLRFLLITLVAAAGAELSHDGACPELHPVKDFNLTAYAGVWYEISKYPAEFEKNGKCSSIEYILADPLKDDQFKVKMAHVVNTTQFAKEGIATKNVDVKTSKVNAAVNAENSTDKHVTFFVTLKQEAVLKKYAVKVLATDYKNYAIAYSCENEEQKKKHKISAWVLSRTKKLEGAAKTAVDDFMKANGEEFDVSKLVVTDFSEEACKFNNSQEMHISDGTGHVH